MHGMKKRTLDYGTGVEALVLRPGEPRTLAGCMAAKSRERAALQLDGKLTGKFFEGLNEKSLAEEEKKRMDGLRKGRYTCDLNFVEVSAITDLVRLAASDGARVILHTPPSHAIHRTLAEVNCVETFADMSEKIDDVVTTLDAVVRLDSISDERFDAKDFSDWVHLSTPGAVRYTALFIERANTALAAQVEPGGTP
jgi:hypothetical protein